MKRLFLIAFLSFTSFITFAHHIVGGEMLYEYLGPGSSPNTKQYRITLKLFRDQNCQAPCAAMPTDVYIGIFNRDNNSQYPGSNLPYDVPISNEENVPLNDLPSCISNPPSLNYHVGYYTFIIDLPDNNSGYTATYQTCCRVDIMNNVDNAGGSATGSTYSCDIPAIADNSPAFATKIDVICQHKNFTLDFSSTDSNGDSLVYSFINAYNGGATTNSSNVNPAAPPYNSVNYINGYTAFQPLGNLATINSNTGIISGIAPDAGAYVVCVSVRSYRNGQFIGDHRKDFIVNIGNCDFVGANPICSSCSSVTTSSVLYYTSCNSFTTTFTNVNNSPLNKTYFWDFGVLSQTNDTSTLANPTFTYPDTGTYVLTLIVNRGQPCFDSTTVLVKIYPGFYPGFTTAGQCKNTPIQFTDTTKTVYGFVNAWRWDFGNLNASNDTSHLQNPTYTYPVSGNYDVHFIVSSNKGCIDTVNKTITIQDKPAFTLTNDTLICIIDTLQLTATGAGSIFWTPNYNINNQTSFTPLVSPDVPTKYYATLTDPYGCVGKDSVFVNVISNVLLDAGNDTTICKTDSITLNTVSNAVNYLWTPPTYLNSDTAKNPVATPLASTTFYVTGLVGKCQAKDSVRVTVVPYPAAFAGNDTSICIGKIVQLSASGGSIYSWSPPFFLSNPNIANPVANPSKSIQYIVTVKDILGCPKPVRDTIVVTVQTVIADAGPRDTIIVLNQPLQLNATGGQFYLWSPATGLNNAAIANPIAKTDSTITYVVTVSNAAGCFATDTITVIVYQIDPGLYVPNAFTPNGDGINDIFRPIPIGMKEITNFRVFNRWGELMFATSLKGQGWDGKYKGKPQDPAVYVWIVEGIDYTDKKITQKGTVVLIR